MNKSLYLCLSILESSNIVMYEFRYGYVKLISREKLKLCHGYRQFYDKNTRMLFAIAKDNEARFDTGNRELGRPLSKGENKEIIGLMKAELGGKLRRMFSALRAKMKSYLKDNGEDKNAKGTKKFVTK